MSKISDPAQFRTLGLSRRKPPPAPFGAEDFAALVADLRAELAAAGERAREELRSGTRAPESFAGRPWAAYLVQLRDAAALAGYSRHTFKAYSEPRGRRGRHGTGFPEPAYSRGPKFRRWRTGDIALWAAGRPVLRADRAGRGWQRAPGNEEPAPAVPVLAPLRFCEGRREQAAVFIAAAVAADPGLTAGQAQDKCETAGIQLTRRRAGRAAVMDQARAAALPAILERLAPGEDGTVPLAEIAGMFGCPHGAVYIAVRDGRIRGVKAGKLWRADPSRLRYPAQEPARGMLASMRSPVPVDKDHPRAVPLPGDKISEGNKP